MAGLFVAEQTSFEIGLHVYSFCVYKIYAIAYNKYSNRENQKRGDEHEQQTNNPRREIQHRAVGQ